MEGVFEVTDTNEKRGHQPGGEAEENSAGRDNGQSGGGGQPVPLFMRDSKEGRKGDAQDEKDEMGE